MPLNEKQLITLTPLVPLIVYNPSLAARLQKLIASTAAITGIVIALQRAS
jgi:hypothetical protein